MTDRELLELAAKAAGLPWDQWVIEGNASWNPLTDDGDSFRLAVALGEKFPCFVLGIFNRSAFPYASASIVYRNGDETYIEEDDNADMAETARRAIVRAAAEIGKSM